MISEKTNILLSINDGVLHATIIAVDELTSVEITSNNSSNKDFIDDLTSTIYNNIISYHKQIDNENDEGDMCENCGLIKDDVTLTYNPYSHELYHDDTLYNLCSSCLYELGMDI